MQGVHNSKMIYGGGGGVYRVVEYNNLNMLVFEQAILNLKRNKQIYFSNDALPEDENRKHEIHVLGNLQEDLISILVTSECQLDIS